MDADTLLQRTVGRLRKHEGQYAEIARQNEQISYSWLTKMAHGQITNPTISSLQQLIDALDVFEGVSPRAAAPAATGEPEPELEPKPKGEWEQDPDVGRVVPLEEA